MIRKAITALAVCGIIAAGVWLLDLAIYAGCYALLFILSI
jgi:hypothetical protein